MEKALVKINFGCKIFISEQIFVALFKTFGMQKDDIIIFFWRFFRTWRYAKRQSTKDDVRRVVISYKFIKLYGSINKFHMK